MKYLFSILFLIIHLDAYCQFTPQYSQYMFNGLAINPAYAGSREVFTTALLYRTQWSNISGSPVTQTLSGHAPLKNQNIALGLLFMNEKIGVTSNKTIAGNYAYRVKLGSGRLSMGLSTGIISTHSRWQDVNTAEQNDPEFQGNSPVYYLPQAGAGVYYYTGSYFTGISVLNLLTYDFNDAQKKSTVKQNFGRANYMLTAGKIFRVTEEFKIKPSVLIKYIPTLKPQADLNTNFIFYDTFWLGLSYRTNDAVVALIEYEINRKFKIGYAYDYTFSSLKGYTGGSHEFMLRYEFGYKTNAPGPRYF